LSQTLEKLSPNFRSRAVAACQADFQKEASAIMHPCLIVPLRAKRSSSVTSLTHVTQGPQGRPVIWWCNVISITAHPIQVHCSRTSISTQTHQSVLICEATKICLFLVHILLKFSNDGFRAWDLVTHRHCTLAKSPPEIQGCLLYKYTLLPRLQQYLFRHLTRDALQLDAIWSLVYAVPRVKSEEDREYSLPKLQDIDA
jgi:hypothetical protein